MTNKIEGSSPIDESIVEQTKNMSVSSSSIDVPKLKGTNYLNWKSLMTDLLELRDLSGATKADGNLNVEKNLQAKLLIKSTLDETHLEAVRDYAKAHQIWEHLSRMCIGTNSSDVTALVNKFYSYEYKSSDSMSTHLEKLSVMRTQLELVEQKPTEEVFIDRILSTLPNQYKKLKEYWEYLHISQQSVDELKKRILKIEEELKQNKTEPKPADQSFIAGQRPNVKQQERPNIEEQKKNSYCARCGHKGHWYRECKTKPENYALNKRERNSQSKAVDKPLSFMMHNRKAKQAEPTTEELPLKELWIADSGATAHMCNQEAWFAKLDRYETPRFVYVGDNGETEVKGIGDVSILSKVNGVEISGTIKKVLWVPEIATNLLSIGQIDDQDIQAVFANKQVRFVKEDRTLAEGSKISNNLYLMDLVATEVKRNAALYCQVQRSLEDWHKTLGHASKNRILQLHKDQAIKISNPNSDPDCPDCPSGKGRHASHPSRNERAIAVGDRVHVDLAGPINVTSVNGNNYYMLCKDEYSSYTYVYLLEDKSKTCLALSKLIAEFEVDTGNRIKRLQTDNGSEFTNKRCEVLFAIEKIVHETTAPYSPQQNGMVEREMQTINNMARTMLGSSKLSNKLWDEAIKTAVYLKNCLPNSNTERTPHELALQKKPRLDHLCAFGTQAHILIDGHYLTKFDPRTEPAFVVGFTKRSNTYRVWLVKSGRVTETCNIIFRSHKQQSMMDEGTTNAQELSKTNFEWSSNEPSTFREPTNSSVLSNFFRGYLNNQNEKENPEYYDKEENLEYQDASDCREVGPLASDSIADIESPEFSPLTNHGDSSANQSEVLSPPVLEANVSRSSTNLSQSEPRSPPTLQAHLHMFNDLSEPVSYKEAINSPNKQDWQRAIQEELAAHEENKTWSVVSRPSNARLITTKWVFKVKTRSDGSIERFKARLVARGFEQKEGRDYFETFAPVARYNSIRSLLAVAAQFDMSFVQFDVQTAFLYGQLEEQVFTEVPEGLEIENNKVLKLEKGLYGLKQSPRVWNNKFAQTIEKYGFRSLKSDTCVFLHEEKQLILCIYVDDGLLFASDRSKLTDPISYLKAAFKMRIVEESTFVGLEIERRANGYFIHQSAFASRILARFQMEDCRSVTAPLLTSHKLTEDCGNLPDYMCPYREAIGALLYLATNTRPDVLHAVTLLAKFASCPKEKHWMGVKRILRYLKGSQDVGIEYTKAKSVKLIAYSDADWASDVSTRKSISGSLIFLANGPVVFRSSQQSLVSLSTTEAEFIAATETIKELVWLQTFLKELGINVLTSTLKCDSQTAIRLIKNPENHKRTKHIDIKFHFIRELFNQGTFDLEYVRTELQLADFLTKALPCNTHVELIRSSNIRSKSEKVLPRAISEGDCYEYTSISRRQCSSFVCSSHCGSWEVHTSPWRQPASLEKPASRSAPVSPSSKETESARTPEELCAKSSCIKGRAF